MTQKITVEEENKLISIKSYSEKMDKIISNYPEIESIKKDLVLKFNTLIIPLAQDRTAIKDIEIEFNETINDELVKDLYDEDPLIEKIKHYMRYWKYHNLKKEQALISASEAVINIINKLNEISVKPITRTEFIKEGEELLEPEERKYIEAHARTRILAWKKFYDEGSKLKRAAIEYELHKRAMQSTQHYAIINNLFFELTGIYVLDKMKKERENKKQEQELSISKKKTKH